MECNRYIVENYISHKLSKRGFVRGSDHTARDQTPLVRRCRGGGGGGGPPDAERHLVVGEGVSPSEPLARDVDRVLREAGDELERLHQRDFEDMSRQLGLSSAAASARFSEVLDELFRDGVNWGRIIAFFEFGGTVCVECASREEMRAQVDRIADWMTEYLNGPLRSWMEDNGGWVGPAAMFGFNA